MFEKLKGFFKGVINRMFGRDTIKDKTGIDVSISNEMYRAINDWANLYEDRAPWLDDENTESYNAASSIAAEMARLVTLEFKSEIASDDYLNTEYQEVVKNMKKYVEYACAKGGLVFKPYLSTDGKHVEVDLTQAEHFYPTTSNSRGEVTGAIFIETLQKGKTTYYRLEHHELKEQGYYISNKAYKRENNLFNRYDNLDFGIEISLSEVEEWKDLEPEVLMPDVDRPLFAYFKIPLANNIDTTSPLGVSIYSRAIDAIKKVDEQWSRIWWEYSAKETAVHATVDSFKRDRNGNIVLPKGKERLYRIMDLEIQEGQKAIDVYDPAIRDTSLFNGLNNALMNLEFKCGLAYGTLSLVQYTDKTAEEIKSSKQRSYSTVKSIQDSLEVALKDLVYAMCIWSRVAGNSKKQIDINKDLASDFDDSLVVDKEKEQEKMRADVSAGILDPVYYLMVSYGWTEKEAREHMPKQEDDEDDNPDDLEE